MVREYKGRWYATMLYGLMLLLIFEGCAKKAVVSDKGIEAPEERISFPAKTGDQAAEEEYVFSRDQILPELSKIEERELKEEEKESKMGEDASSNENNNLIDTHMFALCSTL